MLKKNLLWLVIVLVVIIAGCTKDKEPAGNSSEGSDGDDRNENTHTYPFTGLSADDGGDQRMIGVMVNNHPDARPQTGLSKADIVFEILAEGRITRFLALYQSDLPDVVGPVRSAREYYFDLANDYDALYVYHGAANFVEDMIQERDIEHLNGSAYDNDGHLFKRDPSREAPHNSYLQMDAVNDVAAEQGYDTSFDYKSLPFLSEDEAVDGEPASNVEIVYSEQYDFNVGIDYDSEFERYVRTSDGEETIDLDTEEPIGVENVFVMEAHHEVIDDEGRRSVDMKEGGDAYLFQEGKVQKVEWKNDDGQIIAMNDGDPVPFVPGQTWVNVVPKDPGLENSVDISSNAE